MAKGTEAKQRIANKMAEVFGSDWIGEYEKKYYIWSNENGERIQVAISMTCPKVPIEVSETTNTTSEDNSNWDWGNSSTSNITPSTQISAEITEEEKKNLADLMAKLGL